MTTVLVTGGAGYVGSHACKALASAGYTPVTYDTLERGDAGAVKWGPLEPGDVGDGPRLAEVIRKYAPNAVMHFAAYSDVAESVADPRRYWKNNVLGTLTLLEAMRESSIGLIVFSSSCAIDIVALFRLS
ncbi:MAG: UDP-glucose 4-epimerase [Proteobacteria bacterium]|nr:UDP-glucose 4-epimerase [Pseudomonadota bacterium]